MIEEKFEKMSEIVEESFRNYTGAVLQSRALVDVRDGLKPSARQIFYSMKKNKLTHDKNFKKTNNAVGLAMVDFYIHGDASCLGIIMRAGQKFAMRYPLIEVEGNAGTLIESGNWAAARYTGARLSKISSFLFNDIEKETIKEWRDNYEDTQQYPAVLPSKGFYNLCNGTSGIGVGLASSIPQFNLAEVNKSLIYLIDHPDCDFNDIYCAPDFATGAVLCNEEEIKESLKNGTGPACKLRSVVEFDSADRCFIVKEIPYGVYTNTICRELEEICNSEENPGIDRFNDLTGTTPLIKIYLERKANPDKILKYLYKNTSLQAYYGINFTMLDNGRFPRVFGWKETLLAHIEHEKNVYKNGFLFDLKKIEARLHIIKGLFVCLARIDEVVQTIKKSKSTAEANLALQKNFVLDEVQAKAVLDMKLSRLAHLEVEKLEEENTKLEKERDRIEEILDSEELFNNELKKTWAEVAEQFGDARRTKVISLNEENGEPVEIKKLQISLTNQGNIYVNEASTLYTQRRGGVGNKVKTNSGEYVIDSRTLNSNEELLFFTDRGNVYHCSSSTFPVGEKSPLCAFLPMKEWENVCAFTANKKNPEEEYIIFVTEKGYIKKSLLEEYKNNRNTGLRAITLNDGDIIVDVIFTNEDRIGILTELGNFLIIETKDIRAIGRVAQGIHGIKLNTDDKAIAAHIIPRATKSIASISGNGLFKKTPVDEFNVQGKNTKGAKLQKLNTGDWMANFIPIEEKTDILIVSTRSSIRLTTDDIPAFSKGALGNKSIKLAPEDSIVHILKI